MQYADVISKQKFNENSRASENEIIRVSISYQFSKR